MGMRLLAHLWKRGPEVENAAAERREARRPASRAGHLRRLPEMGPIARRTNGCGGFRTSACSALCSPHFFRERKTDEGAPGPPPNRAAERWLFEI